MNTQNKYTTRDITIVAYLVAVGFPLESYEKANDGLVHFTFLKTELLNEQVTNFYCMSALVNPALYYNTLRTLKSVLRSNRHYENHFKTHETMHTTINEG